MPRVDPSPSVDESADAQDEDQEDSAIEDNLQDLPSTSAKQKVLELHSRLKDLFPDSFYFKEARLQYWESSTDTPFPLLCVAPDLEGTWIRPPPSMEDECFGHWEPGDKIKLPPSKSNLAPNDSEKKQLRRPAYFHVSDEGLKTLLEAPTRDKIFLPPCIFDRASVTVKSSPHTLLDSHLRTSLLESYTSEAYLKLLLELSDCAAGTSTTVAPSEAASLLPEVVRQTALATARSQQSLSAAFVSNTVALRDYVMNVFTVPDRTRNYLRGGDFGTPSLFGPVPDHFASLLDTTYGAMYRCTYKSPGSSYASTSYANTSYASSSYSAPASKPAPASSLPQKRPANPAAYTRAKRFSPPASKAPRGRGAKRFQKGPAGRRSRPGRS